MTHPLVASLLVALLPRLLVAVGVVLMLVAALRHR
jgi:hypothetical protein